MSIKQKLILALLVAVFGILGWILVQALIPKQQPIDRAVALYGKDSTIDPKLLRESLLIADKASTMSEPTLTPSELSILYQVLETNDERAAGPVFMALARGTPPASQVEAASKIEPLIESASSAEFQSRVLETIWNLDPNRQAQIILKVQKGKFPELAEEIQKWPKKLTKENH